MDTQVIVVGAGPVGLMLAGELRLGGAQVIVLERLAEPTTESRASTVHARTMEIFDERGLRARLGSPPSHRMGHFGGIPLDLGALPSRYPGRWSIPQTRVEELLAEWAGELGADIRRCHEVVELTTTEDGVRVSVTGPAGPLELTGAFVVGCDGEGSTIRRLAGIAFLGADATRELLRADVTGIEIAERRFQRLPNGLAIAGRLPSGATRVMVSTFDRLGARTTPPTFAEVRTTWQQVTGEDIGSGIPLWVNAFGDVSRLASSYRAGRILLAGDAAHAQLPAGGQALNLGVQDAVNLGWKLAAEVSGRAPEGLLDSYHHERHEIGRQVLQNVAAQSLLLLGDSTVDPMRAMLAELIAHPEVRDLLAGMISGLDVRYERGSHPLVGARTPHTVLDTHPEPTSTTALLRSGRGVLLDFSTDPARQSRLRALTIDGALTLISPPPPPPTSALHNVDTLLLRPDGYIAWATSQSADPSPAVHCWFGHQPCKRTDSIAQREPDQGALRREDGGAADSGMDCHHFVHAVEGVRDPDLAVGDEAEEGVRPGG